MLHCIDRLHFTGFFLSGGHLGHLPILTDRYDAAINGHVFFVDLCFSFSSVVPRLSVKHSIFLEIV